MTFRIYKGLFIWEIIFIFITSGVIWMMVLSNTGSYDAGEIVALVIIGVVLITTIYFLLKHLSYSLHIEDNEIIEYLWFSEQRRIPIEKVSEVTRSFYVIPPFDKVIEHDSQLGGIFPGYFIPMILIRTNTESQTSVPRYPINPKILSSLVQHNPSTEIDHNLADLLPKELRKQEKIQLTVVETIGLYLYRFLLIVMFILLLVVVGGMILGFIFTT